MADCIANLSFNGANRFSCTSFTELPTNAKKILNLDKHQVANLKIKTKKINQDTNGGRENILI
ncbi:hypothetical protein MTR67_031103 [Solanum verrucosum]|uniref:Uncharacterized protein n=1 Tax=Solanum verrucosum TaxID=315347 RepID=A0AAF0U1U7_SOLVR|nr:hypothetical protein MTR67_031103 [Solanum verrucosum]